jgi:hypothetical protein
MSVKSDADYYKSAVASTGCPLEAMTPEILKAIVSEHNCTVEAAQRAQARAVHTGELLL